MATIEQIRNYKICNIVKVTLGDILLELHLNIKYLSKEKSISIKVSDEGETILFSIGNYWIDTSKIEEAYFAQRVDGKSPLAELIDNNITNIAFGVGNTLHSEVQVIYYIMLQTNHNSCLFFNNGDECAYSLQKIKEILANDIYGYEWKNSSPFLT